MTKTKILNLGRNNLSDLQNMMWTTGRVVDAIRHVRGIETIEQTILRPMEGDSMSEASAFVVIVKPQSDFSVYRLAKMCEQKIEEAKKKFYNECGRVWEAWVNTAGLAYDRMVYDFGGIGTDIWGRPEVTIKITVS